MSKREHVLLLKTLLEHQGFSQPGMFLGKPNRTKYKPCSKCGKRTKDEICFCCKSKEQTKGAAE